MRCLAVLGLRRSGRPAALLARRELAGARVVALDEGDAPPKDAVAELRAAGVEVLCRRRRSPAGRAPTCWSRAPACRTRAAPSARRCGAA